MTNEEAQQRILSQSMPRQIKIKGKHKRKPEIAQEPLKPLSATALPLNSLAPNSGASNSGAPNSGASNSGASNSANRKSPGSSLNKNGKSDIALHGKSRAGLSDDFFDFEQAYGRPVSYEAATSKWTWAKYQPQGDVEIYAGAKQSTSKADIVLAVLKGKKVVPENQLVQLGKELLGKYKSQPLGPPVHTVRYLPSGRVQLANLQASTYHFIIYSTNDSAEDNRYYVVLSRLPGSTEPLLLEQARRSKLLRFMQPVLGEGPEQE